uniref:Uncharacterized protein n=1 Tax=Eutreptiella gymnastica TaxID=73025 RepID=A0A7S4LHH1_9EUGL|mmetsp:Transcript_29012/g.46896  ORF Transcript_29012/g.46896 Transcript_29012/m.46896 type:complete len:116 (+) Transcript_29012:410-757(+)
MGRAEFERVPTMRHVGSFSHGPDPHVTSSTPSTWSDATQWQVGHREGRWGGVSTVKKLSRQWHWYSPVVALKAFCNHHQPLLKLLKPHRRVEARQSPHANPQQRLRVSPKLPFCG